MSECNVSFSAVSVPMPRALGGGGGQVKMGLFYIITLWLGNISQARGNLAFQKHRKMKFLDLFSLILCTVPTGTGISFCISTVIGK